MRDVAGKSQKKVFDNLYSFPTSSAFQSQAQLQSLNHTPSHSPADPTCTNTKQGSTDCGHRNCDQILKMEIEKNVEALKLMQSSSESEFPKFSSHSHSHSHSDEDSQNLSQDPDHVPTKEEVLLAIRKQLANLKDRGRRIKFYVDEMISAYPSED